MTATTDGPAGPGVSGTKHTERASPVRVSHDQESLTAQAERITARAVEHLLARQDDAGWWKGDLETNVTMDAEDLLLREFLGIRDEKTLRAAARFIRSQQREDGTWATFHGGPGNLSTTVEAYVALKLAGDDTEAPT